MAKPQITATENGWRYDWPEHGIRVGLSNVRPVGEGLVGEVVIASGDDAESMAPFFAPQQLDLLNGRAREALATMVAQRSRRRGFDWRAVIEQACGLALLATRGAQGIAPATSTADALLRRPLPEPEAVVPNLLTVGAFLFGGAPKVGKSWMLLGLGYAIVTGGRALGAIPVPPGEVLYLALEDSDVRLQRRLWTILPDEPGWPRPERDDEARMAAWLDGHPQLAGFHWWASWPRLDAGGLEALDAWLRDHAGTRLVMIDTLAKARGQRGVRQARLYDEDYATIEVLAQLAARHRCCVLVSHHLRKADSDDPLESLTGTMGLSGAADGVFVLRRRRGAATGTLHVIARDLPDDQELRLCWDARSASWLLMAEDVSPERSAILELLAEAPEPLGPKEIAELARHPAGATRRLLWAMEREKQVLKVGYGRYVINQAAAAQERSSGNSGHGPITAITADHRTSPRSPRSAVTLSGSSDGNSGASVTENGSDRGDRPDRGVLAMSTVTASTQGAGPRCPLCAGPLEGNVCRRCGDRLCDSCGEWTGSVLRSRCVRCGPRPSGREQEDAP